MNTRRLAALMCVALAGTLFLTGLAQAAPGLDQQQTTLDMNRLLVIGGNGPQTLAQVVTSGTPGLLTQVDLPVLCGDSGFVLEIRDSGATIPGTNVWASQTVTGLADNEHWKPIALTSPPFIPDETMFAIVLSSPGSCGIFAAPNGTDPYPRGSGLYIYPPYPWGLAPDLGFKTYVDAICQVPGLAGSAEAEAPGMLERYGCALGALARAYSREVAAGDVISQSQVEGTRLPAASKVDVVVSRGPRPCKVPNVRRMRLARANATLTRALCRVGSVRRVRSAKAMTGRVIRQRPAPGTRLPEGGRVNLVVGRR
jgi:PASTA domain